MHPALLDQSRHNSGCRGHTYILNHLLFLEVDNGTEPGKEPIR